MGAYRINIDWEQGGGAHDRLGRDDGLDRKVD